MGGRVGNGAYRSHVLLVQIENSSLLIAPSPWQTFFRVMGVTRVVLKNALSLARRASEWFWLRRDLLQLCGICMQLRSRLGAVHILYSWCFKTSLFQNSGQNYD